MKKGKKFGKVQIALAVLVIALGAAVWLNMRYTATAPEKETDTSSKYLGQAEYVNAEVSEQEKTEEKDNFTVLRAERKKAREEALEIIEETLEKTDLTESQKAEAVSKAARIAANAEQENAVETVLKSKGFGKVLAVIGENDVNIIVEKKPDMAGIVQIQDAVASQTNFNPSDVKIISAEN